MSDPNEKTRLIRKNPGAHGSPPPPPPPPQPYGAPHHDPEETVYGSPNEETIYGAPPAPPATPYTAPPGISTIGTRIVQRDNPPPGQPANPDATAAPAPTPAPEAPDKTILVRRSSASQTGAANPAAAPADDLPEGPVVGWLVVVEGPGRGKSVTLGYGMNTIGRDPANRASLPFGDTQISRNKHATLTYDPRGRKFFIQHGESTNLTYVGESPVLSPLELNTGDLIRLGDTTVLKFIPLCGDDFNWD